MPTAEPRRRFVIASTLTLAGFVFGCSRQSPAVAAASANAAASGPVTLVEFSDDGRRLRSVTVPKLVKSETEWRRQLSPAAFNVTRRAGTERAYSGALLDVHDKGVFRCICCDTALFDSATKFESGTGWPSFWQPIARGNVHEHEDRTFGMVRTGVSCARCDAHLGHVFDDGPKPTGLRYCMNSVALRFARAT
ncbi:peptide-methionine (R)-S-oxide reductase MsrB [Luteimonas cucumeris]|nr:peptide-methionine (R)-S-oxide reductase MsrB [Luteimonas cucumeris]